MRTINTKERYKARQALKNNTLYNSFRGLL